MEWPGRFVYQGRGEHALRGREVAAVVLDVRDRPPVGVRGPVRFVSQVVDAEPVLDATLLDVVLRAARDALCPPGLALAAAIPAGTAPRPSLPSTSPSRWKPPMSR